MTPEEAFRWALANREFVATVATVFLGGGGAARHYRRTGQIPLSTLPWRAFRRLAYTLRRRFFSVSRPRKQPFTLENTSIDDVRTRLGTESFQPAWPLSYKYEGEDLNARRYFFAPQAEYPHRQLHVRGFALDEGAVELIAHDEPAPEFHPKAHLKEVDMADATAWLQEAWQTPALDPRTFDRS